METLRAVSIKSWRVLPPILGVPIAVVGVVGIAVESDARPIPPADRARRHSGRRRDALGPRCCA
jgi:hypothetical protein